MMRITTVQEIEKIPQEHLRDYLLSKTKAMFAEYGVDSMDCIGCYVILSEDEFSQFPMAATEFAEIMMTEDEAYLHGVQIISDDFAEDYYLPIGVVQC
ncbi:MAG: hypothetical protein K5705_04140 [Oscillospiraceae bacterium]|nr:hypothetical protein [Oscillospiraceae bacterium]